MFNNKIKIKHQIEKFNEFIYKNSILVLVILLFITILTRFVIAYTDKSGAVIAPEILLKNTRIGGDFQVAVAIPVDLMLHGKNIYTLTQSYGSGFTLLTTPSVYLLNFYKVCSLNNISISCYLFLYQSLLFITLAGYFLFIFLISYKNNELLSFLLLYYILFILGYVGSFGLERGNIDIIFSLFFVFLTWWILSKSNIQQKASNKILRALVIGVTFAFLVNTKFILLPIALVAIYSSKKILISLISFITTFSILGYLPYILFHSPSNPLSAINIVIVSSKAYMFAPIWYIKENHSINAIASLATRCIQKGRCGERADLLVILAISILLVVFTFIIPFLTSRLIRNKLIYISKHVRLIFISKINYKLTISMMKAGVEWLNKQRFNKNFILLLLILSLAVIDLLPKWSFTYRLYFSFSLTLLLWKETVNNKKARIYCLLSIICLSIKGLWIFTNVNPSGFNIFESRGLSIFIILHYYFMIKTGIELLIPSNLIKKNVSSRLQ